MSIEKRVLAALQSSVQHSPWEDLMLLFQADNEAFYLLACDGVGRRADNRLRELASLAADVCAAVRESYEIEPSENGAQLVSFSGRSQFIPAELVMRVMNFLREIDGKTTATKPGKDWEGTAISDAEARFKLGDESEWGSDRAQLEARRNARPFVLRLDDADKLDISTEPAYVTHELLNCARQTILAPTSVFRGLKRGDDCSERVNEGWAFCGKPRQAFDNDGKPFPAPEGMVYLVYADDEGFVFDWDWVRENPEEAGYPVNWPLRFDRPHQLEQDAVLELPTDLLPVQFDPTKASYSNRGDCIFCYMKNHVSYAERINSDLTVFYRLGGGQITGFKVKNLMRILEQDKSIILSDAPDLTVSVQGALLSTLKGHAETKVEIYEVIIKAIHSSGGPPNVKVPKGGDLMPA